MPDVSETLKALISQHQRPTRDRLREAFMAARAGGSAGVRLVLPEFKRLAQIYQRYAPVWETLGDICAYLGEVDEALGAYWHYVWRTVDAPKVAPDVQRAFRARCPELLAYARNQAKQAPSQGKQEEWETWADKVEGLLGQPASLPLRSASPPGHTVIASPQELDAGGALPLSPLDGGPSEAEEICTVFPEIGADPQREEALHALSEQVASLGGLAGLHRAYAFVCGQPSMHQVAAHAVGVFLDSLRLCLARVDEDQLPQGRNILPEIFRKLGLRYTAARFFFELARHAPSLEARAKALALAADEVRLAGQVQVGRAWMEESNRLQPSAHKEHMLANWRARDSTPLAPESSEEAEEAGLEGLNLLDESPYSDYRSYVETIIESVRILSVYRERGDYLQPALAREAFEAGDQHRKAALRALMQGRTGSPLEVADGYLGTASRIYLELEQRAVDVTPAAYRCWSTFLATRGIMNLQALIGEYRRGTTQNLKSLADGACDLLAHSIELNAEYQRKSGLRENQLAYSIRRILLEQYTQAALIGDFANGDRTFFDDFALGMFERWDFTHLTSHKSWFVDFIDSLVRHWAYVTTCVRGRAWSRLLWDKIKRAATVREAIRHCIMIRIPDARAIGAEMGIVALRDDSNDLHLGSLLRIYGYHVIEEARKQQQQLAEDAHRLLRVGRFERSLRLLTELGNEALWTRQSALETYRTVWPSENERVMSGKLRPCPSCGATNLR